jgi:hypothetical protein
LTDYTETWIDNIRQVHARLAETEIIRYTTTDGRTARADTIILDILTPRNHLRRLTVYGITEDDNEKCQDNWLADIDDLPHEIIPLLPGLTAISDDEEAEKKHP